MFAYVGLIVWQWVYGFQWWVYGALLFFAIGIQVIHHNHVHLGIWWNKRANYLTNLAISILTAIPSAMVIGGHIKNHHVHQHGPQDHTRTYRFGGDHNHLFGYLLHPFQAFSVLIPEFWHEFKDGWPKRTRFAKELAVEVTLIGAIWILLLILDWQKFLGLVLVPQLFGLHWFLGANYLQHAHCDDGSKVNYARNFTGAVNWIWFNIGFHTAHHDHPKIHWTQLRQVHEGKADSIDPRLNCNSFVGYVVGNFLLSPIFPRLSSESLRKPNQSSA